MIGKMNSGDLWPVVKQTFSEWSDDKAPKMAAALSYYSTISIAPLLVIAVGVVTLVYGNEAPDKLRSEIASLTDARVASTLQEVITNGYHSGAGLLASIISIVVALVGASGVFAELQDSLNTIWGVRPKAGRGFWGAIHDRFWSLTMVFGIAFLLLVSLIASTMLSAVSSGLIAHTVGTNGLVAKAIGIVIEIVLSTGVVTVLFAAMFKALPDVKIAWKDVWLGGFFTAVLFELGKLILSIYLGKAAPGSAFGAVGSIVVMLVWIFYSSQILFFGAEFTQVYANKFGSRIVPSSNAEPLPGVSMGSSSPPPKATGLSPGTPVAEKPARRAHRPVTPLAVSKTGKSFAEIGLPTLAAVVIGRYAWRRFRPLFSSAPTTAGLWGRAWQNWKEVGRTVVQPRR